MAVSPDMVRRATGAQRNVTPDDAQRVLEIACLAIVSDGNIAPEETSVLRIVAGDLGASARDVDRLVGAASALGDRDARLERLRGVAGAVTSAQGRALAYKVAVLCALSDLAAADEEFEFDIDLQDALEISVADAERLTGEVHEALTVADG